MPSPFAGLRFFRHRLSVAWSYRTPSGLTSGKNTMPVFRALITSALLYALAP